MPIQINGLDRLAETSSGQLTIQNAN
jgi:hypothetical protein